MEPIQVETTYLQELILQALQDPSAHLDNWGVQELKGGFEIGSSIHRLQGSVTTAGKTQTWSLILKVIQPSDQFTDPQGYRYWKREIQAYQSGILQKLPGQVRAPSCYDINEKPDGSVWLWLEDIQDAVEHPWSLAQYAQVALKLGQFNGAYLTEQRQLPDHAWCTQDWLRKYLENATPMVEFIRQNPKHRLVRSLLPGISLPMSLAMWEEYPRLLKILDELPQTFCHQDAFERNLFYRNGEVIGIDWGYAGIAPVGAEMAPLIGVAFGLAGFPSSQAKDLERACLAGYLEGLRQSGWDPDPRQIRLGYSLTVLLRYVQGALFGELLPALLDQQRRDHWIENLGSSEEEAEKTDAGIAAYYQATTLEALKLCGLGAMARVISHTATNMIRLRRRQHIQPSALS
jgi:hypothetical protein